MCKVSLYPGIICLLRLQKYEAPWTPSCFNLRDAGRIINPVQPEGSAVRYQSTKNRLTVQALHSSYPFRLLRPEIRYIAGYLSADLFFHRQPSGFIFQHDGNSIPDGECQPVGLADEFVFRLPVQER